MIYDNRRIYSEAGLEVYSDGYVKISEDFFWKAIDLINWSWLSKNKSNVDRDMLTYKLIKKYDLSVWSKVKEKQSEKYKALREMLYTYDSLWRVGTGDDSTWDLCSHVVGLGRDCFLNAFKDPESLITRGKNKDFVENFGYWIPDKNTKYTIPNSLDFIGEEK